MLSMIRFRRWWSIIVNLRVVVRNQISTTIKKILKDKIQERKVTEKWIEECLPIECKRQYTKSEPSSLSKEQAKQQIIEVSTEEGKQVSLPIINETSGDGTNQLHDQTKQNGTDADDNDEVDITATIQGQLVGYNEISPAEVQIEVNVGQAGSISLSLCIDCVRKFSDENETH